MSDRPARRRRGRGRWVGFFAAAVAVAAAWLAFRPEPIPVEFAVVSRGPLEVTVDEVAEVRVHDRFVIAAPVAGRLVRVELHDGDRVSEGQIVAVLEAVPLDPRSSRESLAARDAARARVRESEQNVRLATAALEQVRRDLGRTEHLVADSLVSRQAAERAGTAVREAEAALGAAREREKAARSEERQAEAALLALPDAAANEVGDGSRTVLLRSPADGRVLRVEEKSERTVAAGTPILVIGDPSRLEIVADVLSTEAVHIVADAPVRVEEWGGEGSLRARVRSIEPSAFSKVSALGIEEKRVHVVMDPIDPLGRLGDGYRVEVRIVTWSAEDVLTVPASAVFRAEDRAGSGGAPDSWAVFQVLDARAHRRDVALGRRNSRQAQILSGVAEGDLVVRYPSNDLTEGARVRPR